MPEPSKDLECLLLRLHQCRRVGANAAEGVGPFRAWRALRVESERWGIEEDSLALNLLDDRPLGQHVLERLPGWQPARLKLQTAKLGQRMVLVSHRRLDAVFRAEVSHEDRDDQRISLISAHLHEPARAGIGFIVT